MNDYRGLLIDRQFMLIFRTKIDHQSLESCWAIGEIPGNLVTSNRPKHPRKKIQ
jgi:hypothetical protein